MNYEELYRLAKNQLSTLESMAKDSGQIGLSQQFRMFSLSLQVEPQHDSHDDTLDYHTDEEYEYDEDGEPDFPEGFDSNEEFVNFIQEQGVTRTYEDAEFEETVEVYPDSVHGVIPDNVDDGYKEVGNFQQDLDHAAELLSESNTIRDEETGEELYHAEPENVPVVEILFTRNDGNELTEDNILNNVFSHPQSQPMLKAFGTDYTVNNSDQDNQKTVAFAIDQNNPRSVLVSQLLKDGRFADFGGRIIVPGVGQVISQPVFSE